MRSLEIPAPQTRSKSYRFFEKLPAVLTFGFFTLLILASVYTTTLAAYFLLGYVLVFLFRSSATTYRMFQGNRRMRQSLVADWGQYLDDISKPAEGLSRLEADSSFDKSIIAKTHAANLRKLLNQETDIYPDEIYHLVFVAVYKEPREIVEPTVESLLQTKVIDLKKVILVFAYEDRVPEQHEVIKKMIHKYDNKFMHVAAFAHKLQSDEVTGKGGNLNNAAKSILPWIDESGIDHSRVIVTTLDADNRPDTYYLAKLTYVYCLSEKRKQKSYQPIALYTNNIWDTPAIPRLCAINNSFFHTMNSMRLHAIRNFSAHSQSLDSLVDADFWSGRTIVEDGHHFWRMYFRYNGDYQVLPLYVPIYQDAVFAGGYRKTLKAQFLQIRRWTYGASDIAYFASKAFFGKEKNKLKGRRKDVIAKFGRLVEQHFGWATTAPLLLAAGWLPLFLAVGGDSNIIAQRLPILVSRVNTTAFLLILALVYLNFLILPPRPKHYSRFRYLAFMWQWLLVPVVGIIFNSMASIYTQIRLFRGKYLENFDATDKAVKKVS